MLPLPARVVTILLASTIARTVLLNVSATYTMTPAASAATPHGWLNIAALPTPLAVPGAVPPGEPPPATTVVDMDGVEIIRIMLFALSATKTMPKDALAAIAKGLENSADVPTPSA